MARGASWQAQQAQGAYKQIITAGVHSGSRTYGIRMTATNATGTDTKTRLLYITVTH